MSVLDMAQAARRAGLLLSASGIEQRNAALHAISAALDEDKDLIFAANAIDVAEATEDQLAAPLLKRLVFDDKKLKEVQEGIRALVALPDPLGRTLLSRELAPGLELYRVSCPIGVLGIVFESRPDALVQIASLALKSGNAVLLKGGKEALHTNRALIGAIRKATASCGIGDGWAALLETHEDVAEMLKADKDVDLIIPRGSNAFVRYIMEHTHIAVMGHAEGLCHTYIDEYADLNKALRVTIDAKTQYYAVCNATETLLVHQKIASAFLPALARELTAKHVELRGDDATRELIDCAPATQQDWETEYLGPVLSIKVVHDVQEAIDHINRYGSHHTDAIVTENQQNEKLFAALVDSADVFVNCSTRFADGYRYGFGAEVGIATGKLHARGPVGLEGLCTYKYVLLGSGQTVEDTLKGDVVYTHRELNKKYPL